MTASTVERDSVWRRAFPTFGRWLGVLGWPILQRQLRADFRKHRFFVTHLASISVLALSFVALMSVQVEEGSSTTPDQIGRGLFSTFFLVQLLVCVTVFPAFSATSFSEERANECMDLLLTTTMRPVEIVWGKLISSIVYCLLYIVASVPLISIAFLFGGIEEGEVIAGFLLLILATLSVAVLGVCISSYSRGTVSSVLTTYVAIVATVAAFVLYTVGSPEVLWDSGQVTPVATLLAGLGLEGEGREPMLNLLWWAGAWGALAVALFLLTMNRIRPSSDDRSSALRGLSLLVLGGGLAATAWRRLLTASGELVRGIPPDDSTGGIVTIAAFWLVFAALVFSTEEIALSRRNRARFGRFRGPLLPLRLLAPGAFRGAVFASVLACGICSAILALAHAILGDALLSTAAGQRLFDGLTTLPFLITAFAGLGFLLASLDFSPLYARLTLFFSGVIVFLLPLVFHLRRIADSVWTMYYLSPATLWLSLSEDPGEEEITFELWGVPVINVAKLIYAVLAVVFFSSGVILSKRGGHALWRLEAPSPPCAAEE